mmetsp:Transcript_40204/g.65364  ORF Transcript_40204/g.65364 Transcript_40204/m.65364 type:complete len:480 (-) Transcript_40204:2839-4278(-)
MDQNMKKLIKHINKTYSVKINYTNVKQTLEHILKNEVCFLRFILFQQSCFPRMTKSVVDFISFINYVLPSIVTKLLSSLILQFRESYKNHNFYASKVSLYFIILLIENKIIETKIIKKILSFMINQKSYFSLCLIKIILKLCLSLHRRPFNGILKIIKIFMKKKINSNIYNYLFSVNDGLKKNDFIKSKHMDINTRDELKLRKIQKLDCDIENTLIHKKVLYSQLTKTLIKNDHCLNFLIFIEKKSTNAYVKNAAKFTKEKNYTKNECKNYQDNATIVLRKNLYIIFMSSLSAEDAFQRIHKLNIPKFLQINICTTIIECCLQEKNSLKFYITLSEMLCKTDFKKKKFLEECFIVILQTIHRLDVIKIKKLCIFYGNLLSVNALSWKILKRINLDLQTTSSSMRVFIKNLFLQLKKRIGGELFLKILKKIDILSSTNESRKSSDSDHLVTLENLFKILNMEKLFYEYTRNIKNGEVYTT